MGQKVSCSGYQICPLKNTVEKAIVRDLITAVSDSNALWAYHLLQHSESLLVTPRNYTVEGPKI